MWEQWKYMWQQWQWRRSGKRKDGSKPDETQFSITSGAFLTLTLRWRLMYFFGGFSLISLSFGPNSGYWCRVFLDLTENFTKHPENRCPYGALIHLKGYQKRFNLYLSKFSESWFSLGRESTGRFSKRLSLNVHGICTNFMPFFHNFVM
jgi:hypothetical protein